MKLYFEVELLSDIILNVKAATEGPNSTLDYIPGSNFMGIVAGMIYNKLNEMKNDGKSKEDIDKINRIALDIVHSGKVRFGDAHVGIDKKRSNKVPASFFYPKLMKPYEKLYISHLIGEDENIQKTIKDEQIKQCRSGFYDFVGDDFAPITSEKSFAIKSAHDRETRTSKNAQMYGYESLNSGAIMYFCVESDIDAYDNLIISALTNGIKRVGRSRSSQYGLVKITRLNDSYEEIMSNAKSGEITVYADSRLIFINNNTGCHTFQPTEEQLGLKSGKICWAKSQIRTFQYSPWNFARQCFDTDRCGIEKGSVIVVEDVTDCPSESIYVGSYKNEGFGRVIFNPTFLEGEQNTGIAKHKLGKMPEKKTLEDDFETEPIYDDDSTLVKYLKIKNQEEQYELLIYQLVEEWIKNNGKLFITNKFSFASQWGSIRSIATQYKTKEEIINVLFDKKKTEKKKDKDGRLKEETKPNAYLTHGIASEKWNRDRLESFRTFCKETLSEQISDNKFYRMAIINLAAEMAKRCRKENLR